MAGEALLRWEVFRTDPENEPFLRRYPKSAKEPASLFECIGEDLGSPKQEVRERGWRGLLVAMPEITSILHERETRSPGWRDEEGKDQQMVNRAEDILSYLHRKFVVEHQAFSVKRRNFGRQRIYPLSHNDLGGLLEKEG